MPVTSGVAVPQPASVRQMQIMIAETRIRFMEAPCSPREADQCRPQSHGSTAVRKGEGERPDSGHSGNTPEARFLSGR
jgi:hypothetical protein